MTLITNPENYNGQIIVERFQIKRLISQGAMGSVYYAEDVVQKQKPVAIKFLAQNLENEQMQQRFIREAGIGARLGRKSIHIVQVISWGMHEDKVPFYVMEFLSGKSLKDILKEQIIPLSRFFNICRQICLGLSVAHQGFEINGTICPVIHRDIKPANILIVSDPSLGELVKILDFGIAKLVGDQVKLTQARAFLGTLAYSSPEQMEGRSLDNRSDIYSLGVVMFEMLTGQSPWKVENIKSYGAWYRIHHSQKPREFSEANPNLKIPQELENLVMQCLAKEPSDRPKTADEVLKALESIEKRLAEPSTATRTPSVARKAAYSEEQVLSVADDNDSATIIQPLKPQGENPTLNVEDADVIQKFVRGDRELISNQSLQINYSMNRLQLTTRKLEILALMDLLEKPRTVLIKPLSKYAGLLNKILLENKFVPWGEADRKGFVQYQQYVPPAGYELQYTEMESLWKVWWPSFRQRHKHDIKLDIMVSINNNWYPIQDIVNQGETFHIKTLAGQMALQSTDKLVWITHIAKEISSKPTSFTPSAESEAKSEADNKTTKSDGVAWGASAIGVADSEKTIEIINVDSASKSQTSSTPFPKVKPASEPEKMLKALQAKAIKTLATYLIEGETTITTEVLKNERGEIISTKNITLKKPCPQWVIEYLLSKNQVGGESDQSKEEMKEQVKNTELAGESPLMWLL